MIRLYVKSPKNCVSLILKGGLRTVFIPFVGIIKLKNFPEFLVDYLQRPVVSHHILFLLSLLLIL